MFRPRFAILAGVLLLGGAALSIWFLVRTVQARAARSRAPLVITVQALYPGANAQIVADTVATPIEDQLSDVLDMLSMSSQSAEDGSYTLHVRFKPGTDLNIAQVLVQNRVSLAMPIIPGPVQQEGISVRKKLPQPLLLVALTAPEGRYDDVYLSNYAKIQLEDELARLPGVGDVVLFGRGNSRIRIALDAGKLTAHQLNVLDVTAALSMHNIRVAAGQLGPAPGRERQPLTLTVETLGRLAGLELLGNVVLKDAAGHAVRLNDVARVEAVGDDGVASLNGKPAALLSIHALPNARANKVSRAVLAKITDLQGSAPEGLALTIPFDFAPNREDPNNPASPEHLVVDAELPEDASAKRMAETLRQAAELLRKTPGVQDVLALSQHPFSLVQKRPCLVVRLTAKQARNLSREQIAGELRSELEKQLPDTLFRLSVPSAAGGYPVYGFPLEFVVEDRAAQGGAALRVHAESLVRTMRNSGKFSDVGVHPGLRGSGVLSVEIDRTRCLALGVQVSDILATIKPHLDPARVNNLQGWGQNGRMNVPVGSGFRGWTSDLLHLQVKNNKNEPVRLDAVLTVHDSLVSRGVERHNGYPCARVTANLADGVSLTEARSLCDISVEHEFGTSYRLVWKSR